MNNNLIGRAGMLVRVAFARLRFLAVFILAALIVGYWNDLKNHVDKWTRPAVAPDALATAAAGTVEYFCPMHPDVVRQEQGQCPKCGMPLVKRKRGEAVRLPEDVLARVQLTPQRVSLANVQTSPVEYRPLTRDIRAFGLLDYDETKIARLSARVAGRADELFVTYAGQSIRRGEAVYSLYSPEVFTAQREYLAARKRVVDLPPDAGPEAKNDASAVYNASLQKLVLWGVGTDQLDRLDEEFERTGKVPTDLTVTSPIGGIVVRKEITQGQYLQVGDAPYTVADLSVLWLKAKLFEQDVPLVSVGDVADVTVDALAGQHFSGTVAFKAFQLDPQTRTLDARIVVPNPGLVLRPGMFATVTIRVPARATPTTSPTMMPGMAMAVATTAPAEIIAGEVTAAYWAALQPYLKAHALLSHDKSDGVPALLAQTVKALDPVKDGPAIQPSYRWLAGAVARTPGQSLADLRASWKEVSAAMVEIGKAVGTPPDQPMVKVFRCPMKKAVWLQEGDQTANPYYGSEMFSCGSAVEPLPKASAPPAPAPHPRTSGGTVLAVPRSAVIDTGTNQIVYVESSPGVFDMKAVTLGPAAGDFYPVLGGLAEGDRVVTVGTFLIDAENRLSPTRTAEPGGVGARP